MDNNIEAQYYCRIEPDKIEVQTLNTDFHPNTVMINGHCYLREPKSKQQPSKDWEIVSIAKGTDWSFNKSMFDWYLKDGWDINQVKRLSDNEIFTVGDSISIKDAYIGKTFKILSFQPDGQQGRGLMVEYLPQSRYNLDWIQKVKQPLFTTADKVAIYEGDSCFFVDDSFRIKSYYDITKYFTYNDINYDRYFSAEENANEYIVLNKPCISLNEVMKHAGAAKYISSFGDGLKELVKSKL